LFETIREEFGMAVVIVTHDPAIAARADREIKLKDGVVV
jgi:predicted ABC-type transport system involved in lysophospholipase L1 biosynthesis ATPase subunit